MKQSFKYRRLPYIAAILLCSACNNHSEYAASGIFEATEITLSSLSSGRILQVNADEGDTVKAGECIALIDTTQLTLQWQHQSHMLDATRISSPDVALQVSALRQQLAYQQSEKARLERLIAAGAATTQQLDQINSTIAVLEDNINSQLSTLGKNVSQIDQNAEAIISQMTQIEASLSDCRIIAPTDGSVIIRWAHPGEFATPGKPILKIANLDDMYLRAYFTSQQLAELSLGQDVTVVADYGGGTVSEYPGQIVAIAAQSEFTPKNIQTDDSRANLVYAVKIAVRNTDRRLKNGSYGHVKL